MSEPIWNGRVKGESLEKGILLFPISRDSDNAQILHNRVPWEFDLLFGSKPVLWKYVSFPYGTHMYFLSLLRLTIGCLSGLHWLVSASFQETNRCNITASNSLHSCKFPEVSKASSQDGAIWFAILNVRMLSLEEFDVQLLLHVPSLPSSPIVGPPSFTSSSSQWRYLPSFSLLQTVW